MKEQPISERDRRRRRALIVLQIVCYGYLLAMFLVVSIRRRPRPYVIRRGSTPSMGWRSST